MICHSPARRRLRVLIAEANPEQRSLMVDAVSELGCRIESVGDGGAAWDLLIEQKFDLLISDVWLRTKTGLQLSRRVRRENSPIKIILLTAAPGGLLKDEALSAGADQILEAPYLMRAFVACVEKLLLEREREKMSEPGDGHER